uniref:Uncharacterized protein n=1 Tax=Strongyloides papillosus TaxID=174720 RepID=A0A0N5BF26_STREA
LFRSVQKPSLEPSKSTDLLGKFLMMDIVPHSTEPITEAIYTRSVNHKNSPCSD